MKTIGSPINTALFASAFAGPIFVTSYALATIWAELPKPIPIVPEVLLAVLAIMIPATVVGFALGFFPTVMGAAALATIGESNAVVREPLFWAAAGAGLGTGFAALFAGFGDNSPGAFALIVTSAASALVCRARIGWLPDQA